MAQEGRMICLLAGCAFLVALIPTYVVGYPAVEKTATRQSCGFESCHPVKEGMLNIHLVPHTHDDVGWLKTVDQYYYGSKSRIQKAGVQYILDSVIQELLHDPNKRFVYVETAFLSKWWQKQHDSLRHQVQKLVNEGRLEIIGGGWSMNDEAVTHYQPTIDQMTWGFRWLNDTFGQCGRPRVAWQIDPFGHARETASLFAQMGFDGLFFSRLDYQDKHERLLSKTAELLWQGSPNLGKAADLFTSILYEGYGPPPGFCFDVLCDDEPIIDDKHSPFNNVDTKVNDFIAKAMNQSKWYSTRHIIMTMGGDFTYQQAGMWYKNLDELIRHVNARQDVGSKINVLYSTPSCYLKAVNDENLTWTTKQDDFFPYGSDSHTYWTGYYTSRPTLKYYERLGNNLLQACKQMYALTDLGPEDKVNLDTLRQAMGIMQHHDAVTGTEKQLVAQDYARLLTQGIQECVEIAQQAMNNVVPKSAEKSDLPQWEPCLQLNISECAIPENSKQFVVTVYNPLSHKVSPYVRFPVKGVAYKVQDPKGESVTSQIVPVPQPVQSMPGRMSKATQELVFRATDLPPLGFASYFVTETNEEDSTSVHSKEETSQSVFGNKDFYFTVNRHSGNLKTLTTKGVKFQIKQTFSYYEGFLGNNEEALNRSSGAYIFRPKESTPKPIPGQLKSKIFKGPLVTEKHDEFSNWASQVMRVYTGEQHSEVEWLVGPIPVADHIGKEVVIQYSSDLESNGIFYTDSNGRELIERVRNKRPTWDIKLLEPAAGNYYPITNRLLLRDPQQNLEFAVLNDRAQGGSSLHDGELELMVHRRLLHDDAFGVGEALNETAFGTGLIARGKHYISGGAFKKSSLTAYERLLAQEKLLAPVLLFSQAEGYTYDTWAKNFKMEVHGLSTALPLNVHLLTLEPWKGHSLLLRLEHIFEKNEDEVLSKPATVNIKDLFSPFSLVSVRETTLGANQWLTDSDRLQWRAETNEIERPHERRSRKGKVNFAEEIFSVTLEPMQIRTFIVEVQMHSQH